MLERKMKKQLGHLPQVEPLSEMSYALGKPLHILGGGVSGGSNNKAKSVGMGAL